MKRRTALATLGAMVTAGCSSTLQEETTSPSSNSDSDGGGSLTGTGDIPRERVFVDEEAVTDSLIGVYASNWTTRPNLRYYDSSTDSLKYIEPENDVFLKYDLTISNLGGEAASGPDPDPFKLRYDGQEIEAMKELPSGVHWIDLRQQEQYTFWGEPTSISGYTNRGMDIDEQKYPSFLFDAPKIDSNNGKEVFIKWEMEQFQVNGSSEPVLLGAGESEWVEFN